MKGRTSVVLAALMFAVTLMLITTPALAQGLPEGVSIKVLAVFPSPLPGIEKVRLLEVRLEPGAKWEGFVQKNTSYWTAIQGQLTVVSGGTSVIHGPGSNWEVPKGMKADLYNNGSEPHIHRVWNLVHSKM